MNGKFKSLLIGLGLFLGSFLVAHAAMKYLTPQGDTEGYSFGTASTDLISFYGSTPVAKTTIAAARNFEVLSASAVLPSYSVNAGQSNGNGFNSQQFAVTGILSGYPVMVSKPTAQTGLGFAGAWGSSAGAVTINFINSSASTITSTAGEGYSFAQVVPGSTGPAGLGKTLGLW